MGESESSVQAAASSGRFCEANASDVEVAAAAATKKCPEVKDVAGVGQLISVTSALKTSIRCGIIVVSMSIKQAGNDEEGGDKGNADVLLYLLMPIEVDRVIVMVADLKKWLVPRIRDFFSTSNGEKVRVNRQTSFVQGQLVVIIKVL